MSHSVTIQTRTVTTGSPSSINVGFCRSWTGLLKIAQVVLGIIAVSIVFYVLNKYNYGYVVFDNLFFLLIATTFMLTSLILVLSSLCSFTTESIVAKTIFELLYHAFGFALLLAASVLLLTKSSKSYNRSEIEKMELTASILGLINSILYLITTVFAVLSFIVAVLLSVQDFLTRNEKFLLVVAAAFLIGTSIMLVSLLFSPITGTFYYEITYNITAFVLFLISSILVVTQNYYNRKTEEAAGFLGIITAILHIIGIFFIYRHRI